MERIGHRGCAAQYPENTLTAMRAAAPHVDAVEFDVRRCASGEPVVIHDATVDRVTDGTGRVADRPLSALRDLDVLDAGEPVPTLTEVIEAVPVGVDLHAEVKEPGVAADAARTLADARHGVTVSSFDARTLEDVARVESGVSLALLFESVPAENVATALDLGAMAVHPSVALALNTGVVERAHDAGLAVNAWTVRRPSTAVALEAAGVDGLITDRWDIY